LLSIDLVGSVRLLHTLRRSYLRRALGSGNIFFFFFLFYNNLIIFEKIN
jgi:hypothetical protein